MVEGGEGGTLEGWDGPFVSGRLCTWRTLDLNLLETEKRAAAGWDLFPLERSLWRVLRKDWGENGREETSLRALVRVSARDCAA